MTINWIALLQVAGVTLAGAVAIVSLVAGGALSLDTAHGREANGQPALALKLLGGVAFALVGCVVLFGLYLLIPYLHR
ncbi:MAG: hypothetical protein FWC46_01160 [Actinomycetia bacterium]|nr:hypothetical protein [Actinomycetes bacterium]